ncbi:MAG: fibronectin type III domain-containing protein [Mogibacterium sp.]|nr:fibronectin type III domain-containing protein [Mogibacterium sp.]
MIRRKGDAMTIRVITIIKRLFVVLMAAVMFFTMTPLLTVPVFASDKSDLADYYVNGYIPIPDSYYIGGEKIVKDYETSESASSKGLKANSEDEALPEAYRSDEQQWAEGLRVKDQYRTSLCWAFAMTSASEYSYAKEVYEKTGTTGVVKELSPGHLGQFQYNRVNDPLGNTFGDANDTPASGSWPLYGGNDIFAMQHAATWSGLALEEKYTIQDINDHIIKDKNYMDVWDGNDIVFPASAAYDDELTQQETVVLFHPVRTKMKELIYKYGAITGSMEFDYRNYMNLEEIDPETGKPYLGGRSYYNHNDSFSANHAVTLVGWDDNYPKENFSHVIQEKVDAAEKEAREAAQAEAEKKYQYTLIGKKRKIKAYVDKKAAEAIDAAKKETLKETTPDENGAWVVQNSWGDVHDHGFFYASYEDIDFNTEIADFYAFDMQPADTYKYNFQYDGNALSSDSSDRTSEGEHLDYYTKPGSRAANVYTNTTGEPVNIEAVGYTTFSTGTQKYDVSIYTGLSDPADPASGTLRGTTRVSTSTRGCKTAALDKPVYVAPGDTYSIVFDFTDFSAFGIETTASSQYFIFEADTDPGQSFFSRSKNGKWIDMDEYGACFRIKGFANPTALIPEEETPAAGEETQDPSDDTSAPFVILSTDLTRLKIKGIKSGKKSVTVTWKKISSGKSGKVSGIEIQYSTSKSFKKGVKTVSAKATAVSKKIKGLKSNKRYYVRMRTYKKVEGGRQVSKWSGVKSIMTHK